MTKGEIKSMCTDFAHAPPMPQLCCRHQHPASCPVKTGGSQINLWAHQSTAGKHSAAGAGASLHLLTWDVVKGHILLTIFRLFVILKGSYNNKVKYKKERKKWKNCFLPCCLVVITHLIPFFHHFQYSNSEMILFTFDFHLFFMEAHLKK